MSICIPYLTHRLEDKFLVKAVLEYVATNKS